ncbi:hypothetical protein [Brevibacterium linens]|uniref:Lipoprotein n=1 Tax=Brevibacterium linens TaxID=1703 RepID=A0A2H1KF57_BRELN|nr:hypothetical protein [Brevibacterium linens]SMX98393.1 hypothetical protein BLIN101_03289 [Brevibacterium linens]
MTRIPATTTIRTRIAATAAGLAAALVLAGCGSGSDEASGAGRDNDGGAGDGARESTVYQFDEAKTADDTPFAVSDSPVTVELSGELESALPAGAQLTVGQYTISAKAFETGMCRLYVETEFANGGQGTLSAPRERGGDNPHEYVMSALTKDRKYSDAAVVDELPSDEDLEDDGEYITEDFSKMTFVDRCSEDADDRFLPLDFLYPGEDGELETFADVDIAVVGGTQSGSGGTTLFLTGDTEADVTPAGEWTAPDED